MPFRIRAFIVWSLSTTAATVWIVLERLAG